MNNNNTMDMKVLTKKFNSAIDSIDKKALEALVFINYLKKNPDLDEDAKANLNRWESKLNTLRAAM